MKLRHWVGCLVLFTAAHAQAAAPRFEMPMYQGMEKTAQMKDMDAAFIATIEAKGYTREQGAKHAVRAGWSSYENGDLATAIKRFNQAWLLDPENADVYHGFAVISAQRDKAAGEAEKFFKLALSKPSVPPTAHVDYGRFLWTQNKLDESLEQLQTALKLSPQVRNARLNLSLVYQKKADPAKACEWAEEAKKNNDQLEAGFVEAMCKPAGAPVGETQKVALAPAARAAQRPQGRDARECLGAKTDAAIIRCAERYR